MYGQMTAGSWIYIGTQGILQGTYETFAAVADEAVRRLAGRHADRDRRLRRHGRRAAAGRHAQRRGVPGRRRRRGPGCDRRVEHRYLDEVADDLDDAVAPVRGAKARAAGVVGRRGRQLRRGAARAAAPRRRGRHRHRPDLGARPAVLPAGGRRPRRLGRLRREEAGGVHRPGAGVDGQARRGHGGLPRRAAPRSSTTATRSATRPARAGSTAPSPSPASCRPTSGRCSARARARSAGRRCPATRADIARHRRGRAGALPRQRPPAPLDPGGAGAGRLPGPAGPDLLARLRRAGPGRAAVQRAGRLRRGQGARS